jgi:hypothetical protein
MTVPLIHTDQANFQGSFTENMAGCAGSAGDLMTSNNHIVIDLVGDCVTLSAEVQNNKPEAKLCG